MPKIGYRAVIVILAAAVLLTGCSMPRIERIMPDPIGPEVGRWHAEYRLSDMDSGSMSEEDRLIMTMLAGDIMFEIDLEFKEDGTFTYTMNTDQMRDAVSQSLNTIIGFFIRIDVSLFTDRLLEAAFREVMNEYQEYCAGTYTADGDTLYADADGEELRFRCENGRIVQLDGDWRVFLTFSAAE